MTTNNPVTDRAREAAAVGDYVLVPRKLPRETKDAILAYMERHCPNRAKETAWDAVSAFHEVVLAATPASDSPAIPNDRAKEFMLSPKRWGLSRKGSMPLGSA